MGLMIEAAKRVLAIRAAEWYIMFHEEVDRRSKDSEEDEGKEEIVTHASLEFSNPELLEGKVIANRRFGFGLPGNSDVTGT